MTIQSSASNDPFAGLITGSFGTLGDPTVGDGTVATTGSWFMPEYMNRPCTLTQIKVYCVNSGTVKLKVAQPIQGGAWNIISNQTLTVSAGLNTFSAANATMTSVSMPAGCLVGFRPSATNVVAYKTTGLNGGYMNSGSDLSGNNVTIDAQSFGGVSLQFQFTVTYHFTDPNSTYWLDENFAGTKRPAWFFSPPGGTAWTFSAGKATANATGGAHGLLVQKTTNSANTVTELQFTFRASGDIVRLGRAPFLNNGTLGEANLNTNQIILYNTWVSTGSVPTVATSVTLSNLTLTTGVKYKLELIRNGGYQTTIDLRITDTTNGNNQSISITNDGTGNNVCGGYPFIYSAAGTTWEINSMKFYTTTPNLKFKIIGDSIVGGFHANASSGWAELTSAHISSNRGSFSGYPGAVSTDLFNKVLVNELSLDQAPYVVIPIGINDIIAGNLATLESNIAILHDYIVQTGSIPVIANLTLNTNGTVNTNVGTYNAWKLSNHPDWRSIAFNVPLSVGGDGVTCDSSQFFDSTHPTNAGHLGMYNRVLTDASYLF